MLAARPSRRRPGARLLGRSPAGRASGEPGFRRNGRCRFHRKFRSRQDLARHLGWQIWIPALDDSTPQTGKVTHRTKNGEVKQVDFLSGVVGLTTKDLARRAIEMEVPNIGLLRLIHPIDLLDSRIQNLHLLPEKRTDAGIAQAGLAVDVVRAFIRQEVAARDERAGLKLLERVADIAGDMAAVRVFLLYGVDPLKAVPL